MVKRIGLLLVLALRVFPLAAQDTLTVVADNPPEWGETPRLVEELRIGVLEGDERYTFVRVVGLVVDPAGVIWVADAGIPAIRRFRPDGLRIPPEVVHRFQGMPSTDSRACRPPNPTDVVQ